MNLLEFYIPEELLVALSLLVLVLVLSRIFWKPLMKIIDNRQKGVDDMLQSAEEAQKIIAEMEEQRSRHNAELERQVMEKMKESRELAGQEYDRIIAEAEERARKFVEAGEKKARRAYEQSISESKGTIVNLALEVASVIVESSMDSDKNRKIVESILQKAGVEGG
jgi:F-type H+-transporting ATPase subunit b